VLVEEINKLWRTWSTIFFAHLFCRSV